MKSSLCFLLLAGLALSAGPAHGQAWVSKGYQMSAMTYDSLGLQVVLDESGARSRREFERMLADGCSEILRRNGITCIVSGGGASARHYPCLVVDLTIQPVERGAVTGDEFYYGTLTFNREVTLTIAQRPLRALGATWSMTLGGQARSRFEIIGDVEERLKDFLEDYLKLNTAIGIWRNQASRERGER